MATTPMGDNSLLRSAIVNNLARGIASQRSGGGVGMPPPLPLRSKRARLNVLAMPRGGPMMPGPGMAGPAGPGLR
jgi:hypothetical protein